MHSHTIDWLNCAGYQALLADNTLLYLPSFVHQISMHGHWTGKKIREHCIVPTEWSPFQLFICLSIEISFSFLTFLSTSLTFLCKFHLLHFFFPIVFSLSFFWSWVPSLLFQPNTSSFSRVYSVGNIIQSSQLRLLKRRQILWLTLLTYKNYTWGCKQQEVKI